MKYEITQLNRTVDLDDEIVKIYQEYSSLRENPFVIVILSTYECEPTEEDVSNEELSKLCNEVMLNELKTLSLLPKALAYIESHYEEWTNGDIQEVDLSDF